MKSLSLSRKYGNSAPEPEGFESRIDRLPGVVAFPTDLGAAGDLDAAAIEQTPQFTVGFEVPDDELRFTVAVVGIIHRLRHGVGVDIELVDHDQVVFGFEGRREGIVGGAVGAVERLTEAGLAIDIFLGLVTADSSIHQTALPLPTLAEATADSTEGAEEMTVDLNETVLGAGGHDAADDGHIGRCACDARGAVGVGFTGRMVKRRAERVVRIGCRHVDAGLVHVLHVGRFTLGVGSRTGVKYISEQAQSFVQLVIGKQSHVHPVESGNEHPVRHAVVVGVALLPTKVAGRVDCLKFTLP
ncbi:MAG: hypothetical protein J6386_06150 [Candidatus Synoicihabitans palmerolidicus]|nr:hypothetical protein [Candidatus Synoicihabitans palmerolidicus]